MKTLVIHPEDRSTTFLKTVYQPIEDKTIVTRDLTKAQVRQLIKSHDRVLMMGHGSPYGLFSCGMFPDAWGYIIDYSFVDLLKEKTDNVFIWCNADVFVQYHDLKGFYSGMFISEVSEAEYCKVFGTNQEIVDQSNNEFCRILSEQINGDTDTIYNVVTQQYGLLAETNPVVQYNSIRLYKQ